MDLPSMPDGIYPFMDERHPLSEMTFGPAPAALQTLIAQQAERSGISIVRDDPVELRLQTDQPHDIVFMVFWPSGNSEMFILMPKQHVAGRA